MRGLGLMASATATAAAAAAPAWRVLSLQSHTVSGFVGNRAAVFPLQLLRVDVDILNSVSLSNHPAHGRSVRGADLSPADLADLLRGLRDNGLFAYHAVLSGYTRCAAHLPQLAEAVAQLKRRDAHALYVCDPVLGDAGRFYVPPALCDDYRRLLLPLADLVTPNAFEAAALAATPEIASLDDAVRAVAALHRLGPALVVVTGLRLGDGGVCVLVSDATSVCRVDVAAVDDAPTTAGCGDVFAALLTAALLRVDRARRAALLPALAADAAETLTQLLALTAALRKAELAVVEGRDLFLAFERRLAARLAAATALATPTRVALVRSDARAVGVVFDLDGTLTAPGAIDFAALRRRLGIAVDVDILTHVAALAPADRVAALAAVEEAEERGWERSVLRAEAAPLLLALRRAHVNAALCTRNNAEVARRCVAALGAAADGDEPLLAPALSRADKRDGAVVDDVLRHWRVASDARRQLFFVGDSADDMVCGRAAGLRTVLLVHDANRAWAAANAALIDFQIDSLAQLPALLGIDALT